jgi:acetyl esterase/lipase
MKRLQILASGSAMFEASIARKVIALAPTVVVLAIVLLGRSSASAAADQQGGGDSSGEFAVWPDVAPGSEKWSRKEVITGSGDRTTVRNVVRPTLTPFLPKPGTANGTVVVIAPGGAFRFLSWANEGTKVAEWLSERGVTAYVLKYRLVNTGSTDAEYRKAMQELGQSFRDPGGPFEHPETKQVSEMAAEDGRQAIKVLRKQAGKWGINPKRIGIMGFSAGAVVATRVGTRYDAESRPDFIGAIYGAPMRDYIVPPDAPPLFVLFAKDDGIGVQATDLHKKWKDAGKTAELVTFESGGHGFGMSKRGQPTDGWIERLGDWLDQLGLMKPAAAAVRDAAPANPPPKP